MFESLFSYPAVLRRHREAPLAVERAGFLQALHDRESAPGTLLRIARYALAVAKELDAWPPHHRFGERELDSLASSWAAKRVASGHASAVRWPRENFRSVAAEFLRSLGRLILPPSRALSSCEMQISDFITKLREERSLSSTTCQNRQWHLRRFCLYLDQQGSSLATIGAREIDTYLEHMAQRWSRVSLCSAAGALRVWFRHCEAKGWVRLGLAAAILAPRIYRHEGLPNGPTWDQIGRVIADIAGSAPHELRDQAILLLLSIYGLRSGEVRRLRLEDLDWERERIRVFRSKCSRQDTLPLETSVGNAIARYLSHGRPRSSCRSLFLTVRAPFRSLSAGGLYHVVQSHLSGVVPQGKGRGPHSLRHACARRLVQAGLSLKQIGDHLGHRSPDSTRLYAKVDLDSLRLVALEDLGGLA